MLYRYKSVWMLFIWVDEYSLISILTGRILWCIFLAYGYEITFYTLIHHLCVYYVPVAAMYLPGSQLSDHIIFTAYIWEGI